MLQRRMNAPSGRSSEMLPRSAFRTRTGALGPGFGPASVVSSTDATSYWSDALYGCCFETLWSGRVTPQLLSALDAHAWLASPDKVATTYLSNHDHSHVTWRCGARDDLGSMRWWRTQPWAIALLTSPGTPMLQNGQELGEDPMSGSLYTFINRRGTQIKVLYWDRSGFCNSTTRNPQYRP